VKFDFELKVFALLSDTQ